METGSHLQSLCFFNRGPITEPPPFFQVKDFTRFELIHKHSRRLVKRPPLTPGRVKEQHFPPKLREDEG